MLGNGTGGFGDASSIPVAGSPVDVQVANCRGDPQRASTARRRGKPPNRNQPRWSNHL